jgi:hypothetical protein
MCTAKYRSGCVDGTITGLSKEYAVIGIILYLMNVQFFVIYRSENKVCFKNIDRLKNAAAGTPLPTLHV